MKHERAPVGYQPTQVRSHISNADITSLFPFSKRVRALSRARRVNVYEKAIMLYQIQWHLKYSNDVVTALSVCVRLNLGEVPFP